MATNLSSLTPITTTAASLSNLVLVSPQSIIGYQPQNAFITNANASQTYSNPSILFHYEGEQSITIESDITDHYIEDNTTVQDQISLKPTIITTHGFIGELNDISPVRNQLLQSLLSKLSIISSYTPALSTVALLAYNNAFQAYQIAANAVNAAVSSWASISNATGTSTYGENVIGNNGLTNAITGPNASTTTKLLQNRQQLAFQQFFAYQQLRTLFTVQTPWAIFQNMAIMNLHPVQEAETNVITDFQITFKQIRLASSLIESNASTLSFQQRLLASTQINNPENAGNSSAQQLVAFNPPASYAGTPVSVSA
jgi:hypothetical protein